MSIASLLDSLVERKEQKEDSFLSSFLWPPRTNCIQPLAKSTKNKVQNAFTERNLDVAVTISSFLTVKEIHEFRVVDRFSKHVFTLMAGDWSCFWKREIRRKFGSTLPVRPTCLKDMSAIVQYLTCQQRVVESEYKHFMSAENFYTCFHEYSTLGKQPGIIGMVCDVGYLKDPVVAAVLSRKRYMTMLTVLTETEKDVHKFKKALATSPDTSSVVSRIRSFLPVMSAKGIIVDADLERVISAPDVDRSAGHLAGFRGYAVRLINLRPEHEHMRYSVFWGLFRDLMVFDTRAAAEAYGRTLTLLEHTTFWCTCLDDYSPEELDSTYPRFQSGCRRERANYISEPPRETKRQLEREIAAIRYSHSIAKCVY